MFKRSAVTVTKESQRIAIAKACGWKFRSALKPYWVDGGGYVSERLPDYLNDLNAIHEAEKVALKTVGWITYGEQLFNVTDDKDLNLVPLFHAAAALRAEALLKAIGKWVEP